MKLFDQFDVEPYQLFYGTTNDAIFSGSIYDTTNGRQVVGSHVSSSEERNNVYLFSDFTMFSGSLISRNLVGSSVRFTSMYSYNERYYDSVLPDMVSVYLMNSGAMVAPFWESNLNTTQLFGPGDAEVTPKIVISTYGGGLDVYLSNVADFKWLSSFPNEIQYRSIRKMVDGSIKGTQRTITLLEKFTTGSITYDAAGGVDPMFTLPVRNIEFVDYWPLITGNDGGVAKRYEFLDIVGTATTGTFYINGTQSPYPPTSSISNFGYASGSRFPQELILKKAFFGFGDGFNGLPKFATISSASVHFGASGPPKLYYVYYPEIRGWKYGLMNSEPVYSRCVFRNSKFGQFRDMLEQRSYSKFYFDKGQKNTIDSPIKINFLSGTNSYSTASSPLTLNTRDSGIYDFEYVSGRPFFDV